MSVPDEGYSRNASCALNLISTFLFDIYICIIKLHILQTIKKHKAYICLFILFQYPLCKTPLETCVRLARCQGDNCFQCASMCILLMVWFRFMVFNATFNNISVISWRSVLLVEETGVPGDNHRSVASH